MTKPNLWTKPTCSAMKALLHTAVRLLKLYLQLLKVTNSKRKKREHHVTVCLTLEQNDMMYNEDVSPNCPHAFHCFVCRPFASGTRVFSKTES